MDLEISDFQIRHAAKLEIVDFRIVRQETTPSIRI